MSHFLNNLSGDQVLLWGLNILVYLTIATTVILLATQRIRRPIVRYHLLRMSLVLILVIPLLACCLPTVSPPFLTVFPLMESNSIATGNDLTLPSMGTEELASIDRHSEPDTKVNHAIQHDQNRQDAPGSRALPPLDSDRDSHQQANSHLTDQPFANSSSTIEAVDQKLLSIQPARLLRSGLLVLFVVWSVGVAFLLCRSGIGWLRLKRIIQMSERISAPALNATFNSVCRSMGVTPPPLLSSAQVFTPLVAGLRSPCVVLPEGIADELDPEEIRQVFVHEIAHVLRRDQHVALLQTLAAAIFWIHPLVSLLNRRLAQAREEICDNHVLVITNAITYSRTLLRLAELINNPRTLPGTVGLLTSRWRLETRIREILSEHRDRQTNLSTGVRSSIAAAAISIVVLMALGTIASAPKSVAAAALGNAEVKSNPQENTPEASPKGQPPEQQPETPAEVSGAKISLEFDKPEFFLGENILLHWRIHNTGKETLKFDMGGDSRTPVAKRPVRFKIEVRDSAGNLMPDPYPILLNFGGLGGDEALEPGEDFYEDLQLMRYREVTKPGEYTIKVYHDLGWEKRGRQREEKERNFSDIPPPPHVVPIGTTTIRFVMPTSEQAREVVNAMSAMPPHPNRSSGKKGNSFADFELLRYPVYLPIMKEMAEKGDKRGLEAIGSMRFPDATAALLELMDGKSLANTGDVGNKLIARARSIHDVGQSRRNYLLENSWTDELKQQLPPLAWKLLNNENRNEIMHRTEIMQGAVLMESCGTKDDLPQLIKVMDRILVAYQHDDVEQSSYPRPQTASGTLARATRELLQRGAQPPDSPETPGSAVAWLINLRLNKDFRPKGWQETAVRLIRHEIPFIRDLALQNLPLPLDDSMIAAVVEAIGDEYPPVQNSASILAGNAGLPAFGPPLVELLNKTQDEWIMRSAFDAALKCDVANDQRLEIAVRRMLPHDNNWNMMIIPLLIEGTIKKSGYGARAIVDWTDILPGIQSAWLEFIDEHRQELREGKRFEIASPPLKPELLPPGFQLDRIGQPPWPESSSP